MRKKRSRKGWVIHSFIIMFLLVVIGAVFNDFAVCVIAVLIAIDTIMEMMLFGLDEEDAE